MPQTAPPKLRFQRRKAFTLLEILLALSILLFSLASLSNLLFVGVRASNRSQLQSESGWLAISVLEELAAGIRDSVTSGPNPIEPGSDWMHSIQVRPSDIPGIKIAEVQVWKSGNQAELSRVRMAKLLYVREP